MYKILITNKSNFQLFDCETNPLGIAEDVFEEMLKDRDEFISEPKVLEYKYSLDGLIEDIESGIKNTNDINLVVAWEAGESYKNNFNIESLLIDGNEMMRQYHGLTHRLHSASTNEYVCDLILLKDLILYLNKAEESDTLQESYDD